jgi:hypothetical protein
MGPWEQVSTSTEGSTCTLKENDNPEGEGGIFATSDGNLVAVVNESCSVPLTISGDVASAEPGYSCQVSDAASFVFDELTIELTGGTTARTTMNASLVVGQTSCIWSSVTDVQRSN